jgi:hypothetical protein
MVDPTLQGPQTDATDSTLDGLSRGKQSTLYTDGAQRRYQSKTTDLIPKRPLVVATVMLLLFGTIAVLNILAYYSTRWEPWIGREGLAALQLTGRSTLSGWFTSLLLVISGFASLQIYALRQHRRDDYRGSYRIWLWIALLLLIASANCVVDLSAIVTHLLQSATKANLSTTPIWWVMVQLTALMLLIARGIYEIRESRGTIAMVALVWISYTAATVLKLPANERLFTQIDTVDKPTLLGNLVLIGTAATAAGVLLFARFVYLQALGLITIKEKSERSKKAKKSKAVKPKSKRKKVDTDELENQETEATTADTRNKASWKGSDSLNSDQPPEPLSQSRSSAGTATAEGDDSQPILKMNKKELKQQRKEQRSGRRAA